jgi:cysteine synthase A
MSWLAANDAPGLTAVAIAPDLGERYIDTIYDDGWVTEALGAGVLATDDHLLASRAA